MTGTGRYFAESQGNSTAQQNVANVVTGTCPINTLSTSLVSKPRNRLVGWLIGSFAQHMWEDFLQYLHIKFPQVVNLTLKLHCDHRRNFGVLQNFQLTPFRLCICSRKRPPSPHFQWYTCFTTVSPVDFKRNVLNDVGVGIRSD